MTKNRTRRLSAGLFFAVVLAAGTQVQAQGGFTLDQFQPAPAGDRFFGVQGADPGGHLLPRLMVLGDYAYKPLVLYRSSDNQAIGNVVANNLVLHVAAGLSLWDRLLISVNLPIALVTSGDSQTVGGVSISSPSGAAVGDLRAGLRLRLLGEARSAITLGLAGYVYIPTGSKDKDTGDGNVHGTPALVLSGETDDIAYAVTAGVDVRKQNTVPASTTGAPVVVGSQMTFGGAFGLLLADKTVQIGPEVYGSTVMLGDSKFTRATTNLEGILGIKVRLGPMVLGAGAGPGITQGLGTPTLRGVVSLAYAPVPEPPPPPPPPPVKRKPAPPRDRDKDGIYDKDDACPDVPGVRSDDPEKNGCPLPPPDRDEDGIPDAEDACPDLRGVKSDDPTQNGCPPDTDGDGIRDDVDACPHEKGKPDPDPTKNGCPTVHVTEQENVILEQVQFKTGSAVILPASDDLLTQVATVFAEHTEIKKIEVQGHTDNRGGKQYNMKLSQRRAASVVKWLTTRGDVDRARLTSQGYGFDQPISDNDTPEGRQKNRRVQFKILERSSTQKSEVEP